MEHSEPCVLAMKPEPGSNEGEDVGGIDLSAFKDLKQESEDSVKTTDQGVFGDHVNSDRPVVKHESRLDVREGDGEVYLLQSEDIKLEYTKDIVDFTNPVLSTVKIEPGSNEEEGNEAIHVMLSMNLNREYINVNQRLEHLNNPAVNPSERDSRRLDVLLHKDRGHGIRECYKNTDGDLVNDIKPDECIDCSHLDIDISLHDVIRESLDSGNTDQDSGNFARTQLSHYKSTATENKSGLYLTGDKAFSCAHCLYSCNRKADLIRHNLTHNASKLFSCSQCTFKCNRKESLKSHTLMHTGKKLFACKLCTYTTNHSLSRHMLTHSTEKLFGCPQCSFQCNLNGSLRRHLLIHSEKKMFACPHCPYTSNQSLTRHIRTHSQEKPFSCIECSFKCSINESLRRHMLTHTKQKMFACTLCDYTCNQSLRRHMLTHSGEKPFACSRCSYTCNQKGHLKRHMLTHD